MISIIQAVLLGVIQGLTEWLPVSSSGHLVIFQQFFEVEAPVFLDVVLHIGTALVVVWFMRNEISKILKSVLRLDFSSEYGRWFVFLIAGSLVTGSIGYIGYDFFAGLFTRVRVVAYALLATGLFLLVLEKFESRKKLRFRHSVLMGLAQALAIIPGISRSGATVGSALISGVDRKKAAKFSFLLSVPAILGAAFFEFSKGAVVNLTTPILVGLITSMLVGYLSLKLFFRIIMRRKLWIFGFYCISLSLLLLVFVV